MGDAKNHGGRSRAGRDEEKRRGQTVDTATVGGMTLSASVDEQAAGKPWRLSGALASDGSRHTHGEGDYPGWALGQMASGQFDVGLGRTVKEARSTFFFYSLLFQ
jgi:hypothetical protein